MLVLTRRVNEEILIEPGGIRIVIVDVNQRDGRVRIGVSAPNSQRILRKELADRNYERQLEVERERARD